MNNNPNNSGFLNGFLLGALIGGGLVFLLGTKKGKRLLKTLTSEGLEGVSELTDLIDNIGDEEESVEDIQPKKLAVNNVKENSPIVEKVTNDEAINKVKSAGRRFFRRVHKRS